MRKEALMWRKLRPFLFAAKLDPIRVENPIHPGTPDVNLCNGFWFEMKCVYRWPARESTPLRIPIFTPQQRVFLYRRWKYAPGTTYLLLEVRSVKQWLLFDGDVAAKIVGRTTKSVLHANARAVLGEHELAELPKIFAKVSDRDRAPIRLLAAS
jgi:hypothetical protein